MFARMMNSHNLFEAEYRRMKKEGIASWFERAQSWAIDPHDQRFFNDLFAQAWMPSKGSVVEYGCGAGQFLRWVCSRGYTGLGIDISETAIELAESLSADQQVKYRSGDVCQTAGHTGQHDICIDGRMSHFLIDRETRQTFFRNVCSALKPNGVFVLMAMCSPIDTGELLRLYPGQKVIDDVLFIPAAPHWRGVIREMDGKHYMPQNYVPHWQSLLAEMHEFGLEAMLIRHSRATTGEPVSSVNVAARLRPEAAPSGCPISSPGVRDDGKGGVFMPPVPGGGIVDPGMRHNYAYGS